MRKRLSRRLAGSLVIELLAGLLVTPLVAPAADRNDYRAGYASYGRAHALVIVDRHRHPAVLISVGFSAPLSVSDQIAAAEAKAHGFDRSTLVVHSTGDGEPIPQDAITAIDAALSLLEPAAVFYANGTLALSSKNGCARVLSDAVIETCQTAAGEPVRGSIRSAFRLVDLSRGLPVRGTTPRYAAVQAVALGETVVIVSAPANFVAPAAGQVVAALPATEPDARVAAALADVLTRVGRKR
jgi:hypothetical protein